MDNLNKSGEKVDNIDEANPITLLKNPHKFKETFLEMISLTSQCLKTQDYEKALKALSKSLDMLDLGKSIMKDESKYWKVCIFGNFACAYQGTWKMQKCNKYCEKIEQELENHLLTTIQKEQKLNVIKHLIKVKFQHCAILSQLNQHQKALEMCQSTIPILQKYIRDILEYTESLTASYTGKKSSEIVHFSKQVCSFAQEILNNLLQTIDEPIEVNHDKSSFYYWQKNPQNNEQQVKKKFVTGKTGESCKRSILGVNKIVHWIDEFNIGTIMHMSQLTLKDFEQTLPIEEYIFKDKLYQIVINCSVAHFTIATQMRFIESGKEKERSENQLAHLNSINAKYGYGEKSQLFKLSEMYHLRAINIMAQNIKSTVPYISHLIKSYDKHYIYKKQLEPIIAIGDESAIEASSVIDKKVSIVEEDNYYQNGSSIKPSRIQLEEEGMPRQTLTHSRKMIEQEDYNIHPGIGTESHNRSNCKKRHKSMGKAKTKIFTQINKFKKEEQKGKKGKKKKGKIDGEKELRIKHESCTQIKLVFKKKK